MSIAEIDQKMRLLETEKHLIQRQESLKDVKEISNEGFVRLVFILSHLDVSILTLHLKGQIAHGSTMTDADAKELENYAKRCRGVLKSNLISFSEKNIYPVLEPERLRTFVDHASKQILILEDNGFSLEDNENDGAGLTAELNILLQQAQKSNLI